MGLQSTYAALAYEVRLRSDDEIKGFHFAWNKYRLLRSNNPIHAW